MGTTAFKSQPTSEAVRAFLGRTIAKAKKTPKYIVCDRGSQFDCQGFRDWCRRKGIKPPRYGAIGKHGSIAVVERFILTMKCLLGCLLLVPYRRASFQRELDAIAQWYNESRPHTWLGGKTPNEVYNGHYPANRRPRFEPRSHWPRGSPCAKALGIGAWQPRCKADVGGQFSLRAKAPAHRYAERAWRDRGGSHPGDRRADRMRRRWRHVSLTPNCQRTVCPCRGNSRPRARICHFRFRFSAPSVGKCPPSVRL